MSLESRMEHLLRAATRAEREGNARLGIILKKMADELRPADRVGSYPPCPQPHS
jgi:hypothetical protein